MNYRLLNILNLKPTESQYVFKLLTVQLFIGIAHSVVNIVAFTLFLKELSINVLPYAYLTIAVLLVLLNIVYEKLEHRLPPLELLKYIIGLSAAILLFILAGFSFGNTRVFVFILMVWSSLFYMVTGYAYWGLVSQLFNVREGKRVFSVVGAGDIPAKLIGYLSAPLLIPQIGIINLVWLAIISLLIAFYYYNNTIQQKKWKIINHTAPNGHHAHHSHAHEETVVHQGKKNSFIATYFQNDLIFFISLLAILSYNVFNFIDFTFLAQVKQRYEDIDSLALFIAYFFAVGRILALIMKLLFTSRVIERLGIIACLFITPAFLFLLSIIFFFIGDQSQYSIFGFGMMVLFTEVLRSTMQEPVFFVLFQPLKEKLRLKGHLISKGYMLPPSLLIVGLSLILMNKITGEISIMLTIKILLINLVIWVIVIFFVRKSYLKTLHDSISKGVFSSEDFYLKDQKTINILLSKVESGKKSEVIYALKLLETAQYDQINALLLQQLQNEHNEIKMYALERLDALQHIPLATIKHMWKDETDMAVKEKVVAILCKYDHEFQTEMSDQLNSFEPPIQKAIISSLLNQNEFDKLFSAGIALKALIDSPKPEERKLAIDIIGDLKNVKFSKAIEHLLKDDDNQVRRNAIIVACRLHIDKLLPEMLSMLDHPSTKYLALQGLQQYGDTLFDDFGKLGKPLKTKYLSDIIRLASKIKGEKSTGFLLNELQANNAETDKVIHSLWIKNFVARTTQVTDTFHSLLNEKLAMAKKKLNYFYEVSEEDNYQLMKQSLHEEVRNDVIICLKICTMLYQTPGIKRVLELVEQDDRKKLYNGMEMIELLLPPKIARELNHLLDHILDPAYHLKAQSVHASEDLLHKIIFKYSHQFTPWTQAVCMYCSWKNNENAFLNTLRNTSKESEPFIIAETRNYVLTAIT